MLIYTKFMTGYGARRPRDCWISAWLVAVEVIWGQLLDAITLGIIFARIAHPKNRARTVFISDCAVIARRDGALKFMFRIADVRQTQASRGLAHPLIEVVFFHQCSTGRW